MADKDKHRRTAGPLLATLVTKHIHRSNERVEELFHVEERYSDLKVIGSGSYGVVCSAKDTSSNCEVAIKRVSNILHDLVDAGRVLRELRLLRHIAGRENTLMIKECYTYPPDTTNFEDLYIVTDLMETDLDRVLRSRQTLSSVHFCYFMYQLLRSVANMHRANILHRDLKPSNLLVNANCDLLVCDLGLARGVTATINESDAPHEDGASEKLTEYVVTRWYRPPEIIAGNAFYGSAVDIWSTGCILAEMLDSRRRPVFRGSNPQHQMRLIISALGVPSTAQFDCCTSPHSYRALQRMCKSVTKEGLKQWNFKERFPGADPEALDLLQKMLVFNPQNRITAEEALKHPWFKNIDKNWHKMPSKVKKFDFTFEKVYHDRSNSHDRMIPRRELENLFLYEVSKYRTVSCKVYVPLHLRKQNLNSSTNNADVRVLKMHRMRSNQELDDIGDSPNVIEDISWKSDHSTFDENSLSEKKPRSKEYVNVVVNKKKSIAESAKAKLSRSLSRLDHHKTIRVKEKQNKKQHNFNLKHSQSMKPKPRDQTQAEAGSVSFFRRASKGLF
jgi:mitogen-activated protein kinase 1/3